MRLQTRPGARGATNTHLSWGSDTLGTRQLFRDDVTPMQLRGTAVRRWIAARHAARMLSTLALTALCSCSLLLKDDVDQCTADSDCRVRGLLGRCVAHLCVPGAGCDGGVCALTATAAPTSCSVDNDCGADRSCWMRACVSNAQVAPFRCAPAQVAAPPSVVVSLHAVEIVSARPPSGLSAAACRTQDVACSDPLQRMPDTTGQGEIKLLLPSQFTGYIEIRSPLTLPMLYYLTNPLTEPLELPPLRLITREVAQATSSATGLQVDLDATGVIIAQLRDCARSPVSGVRFDLDPAGPTPFFLLDGLPSAQATETVLDPALQAAVGGFFNVSPGLYLLTAQLGAAGPVLRRFNVGVRAGSVAQVDILPPANP